MEHIALLLRQAREDRGMTLKEAARRSKIPLSYLAMLEEQTPERKDGSRPLPDPAYLVPHLRDYAAFLGLDPINLVARLTDELQRAPEITLDLADSVDAPPLRASTSRRSRAISASIVLVVVLVTLAFIGQYSNDNERVPGLSDLQTPLSESSAPIPPQSAPVTPAAPSVSAPPPVAPAAPDQATAPTPPPAPAAPRPANAPHLLRAQAKEATWIRVIVEGQPPSDMILQPGQSASWTSNSTFLITIGNAGGVVLSLDDQELPPLGATGQLLRNIQIPHPEAGRPG